MSDDIDEVLSDRPMQAWIFSDETYRQQYYALYAELLERVDVQAIIDKANQLIAPYVEKDPTAFCTYEEFQTGVETLKEFCALRSESVQLQLSGSTETVDAGTLDLSAMGTMGGGMGDFGGRGDFGNRGNSDPDAEANGDTTPQQGGMRFSGSTQPPEGMQLPDGMQMPDGFQFPGNAEVTETENSRSNGNAEATGNTPPNGFGDFGNFSPSGEMPDFGNRGGFNGMTSNGQGAAANASTVILLGVSALFLAVGSFIAFKFKR